MKHDLTKFKIEEIKMLKKKKKRATIEEFFYDTPDRRARKLSQRFKAYGRLSFP